MATGTLSPDPWLTVLDANGNPVSGAKIYTYVAGTTTLVATYTDVALMVANTNPIIADSAGRYIAFLSPGASYKYVVQFADGSSLRTQDNISATPATSTNIDISGVAGENITAGEGVYLSDGSAGKTAGQWYGWDSGQIYSSVVPEIGMAPAAIASGASGTIRLSGQATGLTALTLGTSYYVSTAGSLTASAPPLSRFVGVADSTTTLILTPNPAQLPAAWVNDFRLTLTSGLPVTTADVTAAATVFCTPMFSNRIDLPDSLGNPIRHTSAQFSLVVPATTATVYDIFAFSNAGVATLEFLAWTNATTRATAVIRTANGRLYKTGDLTRMFVGTFRTAGVSGQTEDSVLNRLLYNEYNKVDRALSLSESTDSWVYSTGTWRQARASTANQVTIVVGQVEDVIDLSLKVMFQNDTANDGGMIAIGEDSITVPTAPSPMQSTVGGANQISTLMTMLRKTPVSVGYHVYAWLERGSAGAQTWFGDNGDATLTQSGMQGVWRA